MTVWGVQKDSLELQLCQRYLPRIMLHDSHHCNKTTCATSDIAQIQAQAQDLAWAPDQAQEPPQVPMHAPASAPENVIQQSMKALQALGAQEKPNKKVSLPICEG